MTMTMTMASLSAAANSYNMLFLTSSSSSTTTTTTTTRSYTQLGGLQFLTMKRSVSVLGGGGSSCHILVRASSTSGSSSTSTSSNGDSSVSSSAAAAAAAAIDDDDCNQEECAPEKEVGKVSMEWLASERTQVVGTFPPLKKRWTGYVEKDTAGQKNIYSIEPTVYVAESTISSGVAGTSAEGSENTAAIVAGLALISVAAASSVLIQVGKGPTASIDPIKSFDYSGPALSYYISKFTEPEIIEAAVLPKESSESAASITEPTAKEEEDNTSSLSGVSEMQQNIN